MRKLILSCLFVLFPSFAFADGIRNPDIVLNDNRFHDLVFEREVSQQNQTHENLTEADILELDRVYRSGDETLIAQILNNPTSAQLQQIQEKSDGLYREIFVTDNKGLNVGMSQPTGDYWQGDEAKFTELYMDGSVKKTFHMSEIEYDPDIGVFTYQVSFPIEVHGAMVGMICVTVDALKSLYLESEK